MKPSVERVDGRLGRERLKVRTFASSQAMHAFLNRQTDNAWRESSRGLKTGTYAFVGGAWCNVRTLDSTVLAHV